MKNKIAKNRITVENGAIASVIKSLSSKILTTKTSSFHKNAHTNKRTAFSVAEAFIVLLVGSIALGMSAPMITKQIKAQNMTDTQFRVINREADELRDLVNDLMEEIEDLRNNNNGSTPSGAVMYFDLSSCPEGWTPLTNKYPKAANAFIRNLSGSGRTIGSYQSSAVPNVKGWFHALDQYVNYSGPFYNDPADSGGFSSWGGSGQYFYRKQKMDLSKSSSVYKDSLTEVRPDNIVLLACRRN